MTNYSYPSWLKINDDKLFFWHHTPTNNNQDIAVIIIGPIGPEYMPCHRSIKILAEKIASLGFNCIRYDPIGMGNSSGSLEDLGIWRKWIEAPSEIENHLKSKFKTKKTILIGLRSGCFILSEVLKSLAVNDAIFWHPQKSGSTFIRGIQLLDSVLYKDTNKPAYNLLEGGGYPFTSELQNEINHIEFTSANYHSLKNVLIINSESSSKESALERELSFTDINLETVFLDGLDDMIKQVTLSKIPHSNINYINDWLNKQKYYLEDNLKIKPTPQINYKYIDFEETAITIQNKRKLFCILTTPSIGVRNKIVVFANTGAAHHVGPNRIHVEAARVLAPHGISTLRIDLSNIGESAKDYTVDPPEEFPVTASEDINIAIHYLSELYVDSQILLCGISAGAHNIFHAALESNNKLISKIIVINPETFYWNPKATIFSSGNTQSDVDHSYYKKQMYSYKKWLALITNPRKLYNTSIFVLSVLYKKFKFIVTLLLSLINIHIKGKLENDLILLENKKIHVTLIHSKDDPGQKILKTQAPRTIKRLAQLNLYNNIEVPDADHTFSSLKSRENLYNALLESTLHE